MNSTDTCGNQWFLDIGPCAPDEFCCTARFEANPDASGIGVILAFAANGVINNIGATWLWYLKQCKRKQFGVPEKFERWVQSLCDFLAHASLFLGITILVAAWSQFKEITSYHFYVSMVLADLATSGRIVVLVNLILTDNRVTKIQASLAALFQFLFIGSLIEVIRRMSDPNWKNESGKCFVMSYGGHENLKERAWIRFWVIMQLVVWSYWHLVCPLAVYAFRHLIERFNRRVRWWFSFIGYLVLDLFLFIWDLYLVCAVIAGNRAHVIGNEMELGFGQVAALVALFTVCYAVFLNYEAYRVQCRAEREREEIKLQEGTGSEDGGSTAKLRAAQRRDENRNMEGYFVV